MMDERLVGCEAGLAGYLPFDEDGSLGTNGASVGFPGTVFGTLSQPLRSDADADGTPDMDDALDDFHDCLVPSFTVTQRCANYLRSLPR